MYVSFDIVGCNEISTCGLLGEQESTPKTLNFEIPGLLFKEVRIFIK